MAQSRDVLVKQAMESAVRSGNEGWYVTTCPFCAAQHNNARRRCFGILKAQGVYRCFRCGVKGRLGGFESSPQEARVIRDPKENTFQPPEGFSLLADDNSISLGPAREYVQKRGVHPDIVRSAQLGGCAYGFYRGRVVVPVLDQDERTWLGFSARSWLPRGQVEAPYLNPGGMLKGQIFYNVKALFADAEFLLVVEGAFDSLVLMHQLNVAAFLGKPSLFQEDMLVDCPLPVISVLDGDAWRDSQALCWRLQLRGKKAGWLRLPPAADPGSLGPDWVASNLRYAV